MPLSAVVWNRMAIFGNSIVWCRLTCIGSVFASFGKAVVPRRFLLHGFEYTTEENVVNEDAISENLQMKKHNMEPDEECAKLNIDIATGNSKEDISYEANMEAVLDHDDVVRAGGFGATDDIGSFLPVAMDATDFEASLRDAREFEGPQEEIFRPGLGWKEPINPNSSMAMQI